VFRTVCRCLCGWTPTEIKITLTKIVFCGVFQLLILGKLPVQYILKVSQICRELLSVANDSTLWQHLVFRDFGESCLTPYVLAYWKRIGTTLILCHDLYLCQSSCSNGTQISKFTLNQMHTSVPDLKMKWQLLALP